jgi:O-antigen ligase
MPSDKTKSLDYQTIKSSAPKKGGGNKTNVSSLKSSKRSSGKINGFDKGLKNPKARSEKKDQPSEIVSEGSEAIETDIFLSEEKKTELKSSTGKKVKSETKEFEELAYAEQQKILKKEKKAQKDWDLLGKDNWLARNGHFLTYTALYMFSIIVLLRPYEIIDSLSFLSATAFYFAALTLALYIPTQLITEGNFTKFSTEIKAVLALVLVAIITMPIAKSFGTAWEAFNDIFIKAVAMFIVMVNVLRTRQRLLGMMWLSMSIAIYLSFTALDMYSRGEMTVEGYRVAPDVGGMFGNPNDMAMHLVMMTPLAITLGIASRKMGMKIVYFVMAGLFVAANTVTYSRGGFLGLLAMSSVLVWKLGRKSRLKISIISIIVGILFILLAPGNYGERMLSIFNPSLDAVGSSSQRQDLLIRSIQVTLRNPWGIGIGNFKIVGYHNLGTHNSYTQISSELGLLGLALYLTFILSPLRKLFAMQRRLYAENELNWFYYLSIGLQASIIGFMVSSFFGAVAYNWFIYYLIAYAVGFRRIYQIGLNEEKESGERASNPSDSFNIQRA